MTVSPLAWQPGRMAKKPTEKQVAWHAVELLKVIRKLMSRGTGVYELAPSTVATKFMTMEHMAEVIAAHFGHDLGMSVAGAGRKARSKKKTG